MSKGNVVLDRRSTIVYMISNVCLAYLLHSDGRTAGILEPDVKPSSNLMGHLPDKGGIRRSFEEVAYDANHIRKMKPRR